MSDRPLSPITERSSFSSARSDPSPPSPVIPTRRRPPPPLREISYESEREGDSSDGDDTSSLSSKRSSGETITPARILEGEVVHIEDTSMALPSPADRLTMARPLPIPGRSPISTSRASTPSTPASINFADIPQPGGLLPPPRSKRETTSLVQSSQNRVKRKSHVDPYPGGREPINLDQDTDDEDYDTRSVATATTAGIAGVGAGDRVRGEELTSKMEVEKVQHALRGIAEEQEQAFKRYRENTPTPTPPRSRPTSFFYDQAHPTLHNIPTFPSPPPELVDPALLSPNLSPRVRTPSKLFKSPPPSRPVSRPGSIKGGKGTEREGTGEFKARPSTYHAGMPFPDGDGSVGLGEHDTPTNNLTLHDALGLGPPDVSTTIPSVSSSSQAPSDNTAPKTARTKSASAVQTARTPKTPPSTKRRTSRIIPNVLVSLFSDTPSERKRELGAIESDASAQKIKDQPKRVRSRLAKSRRTQSEKSSVMVIPLDSAPAPAVEEEVQVPESTIRKSGTFGVRDDGSEVFLSDGAPASPIGLGLRRWSSSRPATTADRLVPLGQPIDTSPPVSRIVMDRQRAGSFRTIDTQGTARTFEPDKNRGLYAADAESSVDDLSSERGGGAVVEDGLPPISERSCASHETVTQIDHSSSKGVGVESPRTPEIRTPDLNLNISAVTPPHPLPARRILLNPLVVGVGHDGRIGSHHGQLGGDYHDRSVPPSAATVQRKQPEIIREVQQPDSQLAPPTNELMVDESTQTSARSTPRRRLPSVPYLPYSTAASPDPVDTRHRRSSLPSAPPVIANGLPPLPESLQGNPALLQAKPEDLPLLIASHLLSSHAASLMYQSTSAKGLSEEMYRLAEVSLEWGKVLMDMASQRNEGGETADAQSAVQPSGPSEKPGPDRYDGMPQVSDPAFPQDAYTRLPVRREPKVSTIPFPPGPSSTHETYQKHQLSSTIPQRTPTLSPSSPIPTYLHPSIITPRPARNLSDRHKKAESLPPDWFRQVQDLGSAGWESLHSAEQVWREGMADQASLWSGQANSSIMSRTAEGTEDSGLLTVDRVNKMMTSQEYVALEPLDPAHRERSEEPPNAFTIRQRPPVEDSRITGSRKLVKQPSTRKTGSSSGTLRSQAVGSVRKADAGTFVSGQGGMKAGRLSDKDDAGEQRKKSRWWRRKGRDEAVFC